MTAPGRKPTGRKPAVARPASSHRRRIATICRRLDRAYGPVQPPPQEPVLDALVGTILSQSTSDVNSAAAYESLRRRYPDWERVRRAPVSRIAEAIRCGGLAEQKAPRIKAILDQIARRQEDLSLEFVRTLPVAAAMEYLQAFHGVGPKTAACVLLFACGRPVLPVDTHVHRVSLRLGLIAPRVGAAAAQRLLAAMVPAELVLSFHIQLIRHGRRMCTARRPQCGDCPLLDLCPAGLRQWRGSGGPAAAAPARHAARFADPRPATAGQRLSRRRKR